MVLTGCGSTQLPIPTFGEGSDLATLLVSLAYMRQRRIAHFAKCLASRSWSISPVIVWRVRCRGSHKRMTPFSKSPLIAVLVPQPDFMKCSNNARARRPGSFDYVRDGRSKRGCLGMFRLYGQLLHNHSSADEPRKIPSQYPKMGSSSFS